MKPEVIADYGCVTGEGPLWHATERRLYWVDIPRGRLFRYDPASGRHEQCYQAPGALGGFTIQEDGALLLFLARGAIQIWRGEEPSVVVEEIPEERSSRFNDVIADPEGRVYCGTMPTAERPGRLYRLDRDRTLVKLLDGIGTSNGMGFTPDRAGMYYTDSGAKRIYLFDYDQASGAMDNQRVFVALPPDRPAVPDGMTVDAEGFVWSAHWDGGCLVRYSPAGEEVLRVEFPARKVSSVTFGGDEHRDIYVTTAGGDDKAAEGSGAGALFRLDAGVRGVPEFHSRIDV